MHLLAIAVYETKTGICDIDTSCVRKHILRQANDVGLRR